MDNRQNGATTKSTTFQMRINPEVKRQVESVFSTYGLTLTDAVNIFIQQSLNEQGLPFLLSPENAEFMKAKAADRLMAELQRGLESTDWEEGWVSESDAYRLVGVGE